MSKNPRLIFASGLLMLAILACNLPSSQSSSQPDLAATITAQAMLLETPTGTSESQTETPTQASPVASVSATATPPAMTESQTNTPKPTKTPKPTETPIPIATLVAGLRPPINLSGSRTCATGLNGLIPFWKEAYTLNWAGNDIGFPNIETSFRVYMNNTFIGVTNFTSFGDTFQYDQRAFHPSKDVFRVDLYYVINADSALARDVVGPTVDVSRCP